MRQILHTLTVLLKNDIVHAKLQSVYHKNVRSSLCTTQLLTTLLKSEVKIPYTTTHLRTTFTPKV